MTPVVQLKMREKSAPQERIVPARLPAGHEVEALVELREELRDLGRIVLEVGVDRHDDLAARLEEAGLQRGRLPEVPAQADDHDVRVLVVEPGEDREAAVGRAVVDEDDLERLVLAARARPRSRCRAPRASSPR